MIWFYYIMGWICIVAAVAFFRAGDMYEFKQKHAMYTDLPSGEYRTTWSNNKLYIKDLNGEKIHAIYGRIDNEEEEYERDVNMTIPRNIIKEEPGLSTWNIITAYRGSIAHNMYVPKDKPTSIDDKDVMAICVPPKEYYYGLEEYGSRGTVEIKEGEWDIVVYEIRKFLKMLENGNPNAISVLWLNENMYISNTPEGKYLIGNRDVFACKHLYHSFTGYAHDQLYKMTHLAYKGYMGEKRKQLVDKFGYDTKNAAHLIRLMRMCIEFLFSGELIVFRPDAKELLTIKNGEWTLEEVQEEAERLFELAQDAFVKSRLPEKPNRKDVNQILLNICEMRLEK